MSKSSDLLKRLKKNTNNENVDILSESKFFKTESVPTNIPLLNVALSGDPEGGLTQGITMICGDSKTFKTGFLVQMVLAHQKKYKDSVCLFYDSEFSPLEYWSDAGVDINKILHVPVTYIEEMKNDIANQLVNELTLDDNIIIVIDSIGGLASRKEAEDAVNDDDKVDFTRAKALNSFFRIVTPHLNMKGIPMCLINSHYQTMEKFAKNVVAGGKKSYLSSDDVWFISRAQDKDGKDLVGYNFTVTADKSRTVKEGSKFPINVTWQDGIDRYSGIFDLAVEAGLIKQSAAWYQRTDLSTGVVSEKKQRRTAIETPEYMEEILGNETFISFVQNKYLLN